MESLPGFFAAARADRKAAAVLLLTLRKQEEGDSWQTNILFICTVYMASQEIGKFRMRMQVLLEASDQRLTQSPDFPPRFSSRRTSVMTMPRSIALHIS